MAKLASGSGLHRPRSPTRKTLLLLLFCLSPAYAAAPDRCLTDSQCRAQTEKASQLAAQTRYDDALARYLAAYERTAEPRLLLNIGRCHYRLGQARKALEYFEQFQQAMPDPDPELDVRARQFIAEAKLAIMTDHTTPDTQRPDPKTAPERPAIPADVTPPKQRPTGSEPTALPETPQPSEAPPGSVVSPPPSAPGAETKAPRPAWRIGVGAAAAGLGAVAVGLGATLLHLDGTCYSSDAGLDGLCVPTGNPDGTRSVRLVDSLPAGVGLVVTGGVFLIGGAVLIGLPGRRVKGTPPTVGAPPVQALAR